MQVVHSALRASCLVKNRTFPVWHNTAFRKTKLLLHKKSGVAVTPDSTKYLIHHSLPTTVLTDRFKESGFNLLNRLHMRTVPLRYILFPLTPYLNSLLLSISLSSRLLFSYQKQSLLIPPRCSFPVEAKICSAIMPTLFLSEAKSAHPSRLLFSITQKKNSHHWLPF